MAVVDPHLLRAVPSSRFELRLHEINPEDIEPNGDRYVVEVIDIDEKVEFGSILVVTQQQPDKPGGPMADPTVERRGVLAAVVIRAGNGHLLGLPDWAEHEWSDTRDPATVEMFFKEGDVLLVDHTAKGRALKIVGRECRIIGQIDVLARVEGVRLKREDGTWVQE